MSKKNLEENRKGQSYQVGGKAGVRGLGNSREESVRKEDMSNSLR